MSAPSTAADLLDLVRKSGVADDARVRAAVGAMPSPPADAAGLAEALVSAGLLTRFQADHLRAGKWKRFSIGKYKVLERLGAGGMGQVFLCEHKLMRRRVAVKVLPAAKAFDPGSLERFYREARAVAALDHPNIVRAFDIDQDEGLHFLVMEYVDGTNLHDLVERFGPLPPVRAAQYIRQAAVGLQHAHEMGLVHRDVKPANLLVDRAGTVKVLDLGLARFFRDTGDQLTKKFDDAVVGTVDYLAPEQALDSHLADIRSDLYALGGTLYYLLSGRRPFPDGTAAQKLVAHQTRPPAPLGPLAPLASDELVAVVGRLLAKEPADRFQTPAELAAALEAWADVPVPPPAANELPHLSPAATGAPALSSQTHARTTLTFRPPTVAVLPRPAPPAGPPAPLMGAPLTPQAAGIVPAAEPWADPDAEPPPVRLTVVPEPAAPAVKRLTLSRWLAMIGILILLAAAGMTLLPLARP